MDDKYNDDELTDTRAGDKPFAYDAEGRPLYSAPPAGATVDGAPAPAQTTVVHMTRAVEPMKQEISEETKKRHEDSVALYPELNLSSHEYVIRDVRRHPIGMVLPLVSTVIGVSIVLLFVMNYDILVSSLGLPESGFGMVVLMAILMIILLLIGGYLAAWVYINNRFFLTNESVIQEIQTSIFSRREQTVSLQNIEDSSYRQHGLIQTMFNYGSIRLSTEGDETTYRFDYVANPKREVGILNNAVEAFKNGRPVGEEDINDD
jgi:uncharacterized membrane protein YdbT with pleckstrin-like domain